MEFVVGAILTLSYITSDDQKKFIEAESRVCVIVAGEILTTECVLQSFSNFKLVKVDDC